MPESTTDGNPSMPALTAKTFSGKEIPVTIKAAISSPDSAFFHRFTVFSSSFLSLRDSFTVPRAATAAIPRGTKTYGSAIPVFGAVVCEMAGTVRFCPVLQHPVHGKSSLPCFPFCICIFFSSAGNCSVNCTREFFPVSSVPRLISIQGCSLQITVIQGFSVLRDRQFKLF